MPFFGKLSRLSEIARLSHSTELLLSAGVPLAHALRDASEAIGGQSGFKERFGEAADAIEAGKTASEIFAADNLLPTAFKELFRIGEQTNRVPDMLAALSKTLADQVDRETERLLTLLTPIITLVLGMGIGLLIYVLMGAILEVNELAF